MIVDFSTAEPGSIFASTPKWMCIARSPYKKKGGKGGNNGGHKKKDKKVYKNRTLTFKEIAFTRDGITTIYKGGAKECAEAEHINLGYLQKVLVGLKHSLHYEAKLTGNTHTKVII